MRVGVLAHEMEGETTGVGRAAAELVAAAAEARPRWRFCLFFHGRPAAQPLCDLANVEAVWAGRGGRVVLWEQTGLVRQLARHDLDLLYGPSYSLPLASSVPGVVTLHDLSFERLPDEFAPRERWRRRLLARFAARRASRVLVDREAMAGEVALRYGVAPARIGRVPIPVAATFSPGRDPEGDLRLLVPLGVGPPYWLVLGSLLDRRRPDLVLGAFARAARSRPDLTLVIAGANRLRRPEGLERWISELGLSGRVRLLGWVGEEAVAPLLRRAELAFYLSTYEGYGLPPLEALACGTPVVVSSGLALDDLWPDYPGRARELTLEAVTAAAGRLADAASREAVRRQAPERLAAVSRAAAGESLAGELEKAVAG
ncbi:MAG TPA: glycosyltransferase [Thermoanaerobaculia bacterium]|nr:glycosyltransferase [Thermoanaerobaculia bacterium]